MNNYRGVVTLERMIRVLKQTVNGNLISTSASSVLVITFFLVAFPLISSVHGNSLLYWNSVDELYPGISHTHLQVDDPRPMRINALRVDLHNPDIRFHTTSRHSDWGQPMPGQDFTIRTGRQTTSNFITSSRNDDLPMVAAVNAAPWQPWGTLDNWGKLTYQYAGNLGLAVSDGQLVSYPSGYPSLVVDNTGTASIVHTSGWTEDDYADVHTAVSGFGFVLNNGVSQGGTSPEPRTGYGLSQDGRYLVLMTIDGRQPGFSEGAGTREVGDWLFHFGSWTGLNMDGGGSTTMALVNPDTENVFLANSPSDTFLYGSRRVGNNLGILVIPEPSTLILLAGGLFLVLIHRCPRKT